MGDKLLYTLEARQHPTEKEKIMPQSAHDRAAELHNLAAHAHAAAAIAHGKGDHLTAHELSERAHEHSMNAHKHVDGMRETKHTGEGEVR